MDDADFLKTVQPTTPYDAIAHEDNLGRIKQRLASPEIEKNMGSKAPMQRVTPFRKPAIAAAAMLGVLSLSVMAYAAVPFVIRHFNTQVLVGEQYVSEFIMGEVDLPDGTTSILVGIDIDPEATGPIIVSVDGEEMVIRDELRLDNLADGLALLALDHLPMPTVLPTGFVFDTFVFPVNPLLHAYAWESIPADKFAAVYFSNGTDHIRLQLMDAPLESHLVAMANQQALSFHGVPMVLHGEPLTAEQLAQLQGIDMSDNIIPDDMFTQGGLGDPETVFITTQFAHVHYSLTADIGVATSFELMEMFASMR